MVRATEAVRCMACLEGLALLEVVENPAQALAASYVQVGDVV
jgi:hypothetical protein